MAVKAKIGNNIAVCVEIIKKQQVQVKRTLEKVLAEWILEKIYKIELKLILQTGYDFGMKQKERLRNAAVKTNKY